MKFKPAYLIAIGISVFIVVWFLYGSLIRKGNTQTSTSANTASIEPTLPTVEVRTVRSEMHDSFIELHGRSEAVREVAIKAETAGLVVKTPLREGQFIKRGTVLCVQDVDARQAVLDQANALLRSRELEYNAAQKLVDKGYRSSTQALGALAARDGARASVMQAEIELDNVITRAPFSGIFEHQIAEIGDYLGPGDPCGLLVDLDPLIITGEATEHQVGLIHTGDSAEISLATGENLIGTVRYIESRANPNTRTFRVEIEVPNKDRSLKAGATAKTRLPSGQARTHFIPSNVLALDDLGRVGVRHLDSDNRVQFTPVTIIEEAAEGIWVSGLADETTLIVRGQDYVAEGTIVHTQYDTPNTTSTSASKAIGGNQ
ncbi:MAG: efflux transporter periplasmic adaptor subunit [Robiginitomaculum sp.]|nr:MAG: efflux transporter periplasmic adaptor subunit [Robiginitomaculum sp.]